MGQGRLGSISSVPFNPLVHSPFPREANVLKTFAFSSAYSNPERLLASFGLMTSFFDSLGDKAIDDILNNINLVRMDIIDDVSLGIFVREHKKNVIPKEIDKNYFCDVPFYIKDNNSINKFIEYIKDKNIIFYRNKCFGIRVKHREIDYIQMQIIVNTIK